MRIRLNSGVSDFPKVNIFHKNIGLTSDQITAIQNGQPNL
jgi:hypothetical protein